MKNRYNDFLQFAIENEAEAASLYQKYSELVGGAAQKQLLKELSETERQHESKLKAFASGQHAVFAASLESNDLRISDFMVDVKITEGSSIGDVMVFAMKAEQKASELYERLSKLESDPETRGLFVALAAEEKRHKFDLESMYEKNMLKEF